ncbi:MAG: PTS sugar transporter subunit IIA [Elusimicrobiales bacterium]|nr:PTS sugar transporter subunit IIA [Elusimicrobiales bacterium]
MVDSSSKRDILFEEFFSPTKIIINHQRFESFKKFISWILKIIYPSVEKHVSYKDLEEKALKSSSFSTVFENGLFFPHLKLEEIEEFYSVFVVLSNYLVEPNSKMEVRVTFLLLSPLNQSYFEKHLNIIGLVSNILRDSAVIKKLSEFRTSQEIYNHLKTLL